MTNGEENVPFVITVGVCLPRRMKYHVRENYRDLERQSPIKAALGIPWPEPRFRPTSSPGVGWGALGLDLLAERRILEREPYNHSSFSGLSLFPDGFHALPSSLV